MLWVSQMANTEYSVTPGAAHTFMLSKRALALTGIENVADPIAKQIERQDGDENRHARRNDDPRRTLDVIATTRQHQPPLRGRRLRAETEVGQRGGGQHRGRESERRDYDHWRHDVRQ